METRAIWWIPLDDHDLAMQVVSIAELDDVGREQAHALERAAAEIVVSACYDEAESTVPRRRHLSGGSGK